VIQLDLENEIDFPTITICNIQICGFTDYNFDVYLNKYKEKEKEKLGTDQSEQIDEKMANENSRTNFFLAKEIFLRLHNDQDLNQLLSKNKTSINRMLLSCKFGENQVCSEKDFEFTMIGEFHKCYKFNSGKLFDDSQTESKRANTNKKNNGLQLEFYIGNQQECLSPLSTTSGLVIFIHNHTYTITDEDDGVVAKPGTHTEISIKPTYIKKLPAPHSDCFESSQSTERFEKFQAKYENTNEFEKQLENDLIMKTINISRVYTQQYCLQLCYQQFLIKYCNCFDQTLPGFRPKELKSCPKFIDSMYNCQYIIRRLFYNGRNEFKCLKKCPGECEYTNYALTVSHSKYPTDDYFQVLKELKKKYGNKFLPNINSTFQSKESLVSINIFYSSATSFMKVVEVPAVSLETLISNLGGRLIFIRNY
jgi:hypothetical protein